MEGTGASLTSPNKRFRAHGCWISEIQFLPALEDVFATGDVRGKVIIWHGEVSRNRKKIEIHCLWLLRCHISMVTSISFCHSTYSMSTSGVDGKVAIWSVSKHVFDDQTTLKLKQGKSFEEWVRLEYKQTPEIRLGGHKGGIKQASVTSMGVATAVEEFGKEGGGGGGDTRTTAVISCGTDQQVNVCVSEDLSNGVAVSLTRRFARRSCCYSLSHLLCEALSSSPFTIEVPGP